MFELLKMNLSKLNQLCTTIFPHIKFPFISLFVFFLFISISSCNEFFFSDGHSNDKIETLMRTYVKAWSDGDVNKITDHIYEAPLTIRYQDSVIVLGNKERIRFFLNQTFENLQKSNYGYSVINNWESKTIDKDIVSFKMNYTRFLEDGSIMGDADRETSYVLKKNINGDYRIKSLIPKTPIE